VLLAIDSSTLWVGLALYDGNQVYGEIVWRSQNHHTVELAPAVDELLKRSGVNRTDLKAVGMALGPGSFTSLRIGLALGKGLALALHIPVIGIPTLDFLAAAQPLQDTDMAAVLQAGRGRLAVVHYRVEDGAWKAQDEPVVMTVQQLEESITRPTLICGELGAEERQIVARKWKKVSLAAPALCVRRPAYLAELAWKRFEQNDFDDAVTLSPIYVHVNDPILG
jgi:tRNA threonylcarbamoyladenosine biosynthesis protein TsaB